MEIKKSKKQDDVTTAIQRFQTGSDAIADLNQSAELVSRFG
jgi:hypothetical protein